MNLFSIQESLPNLRSVEIPEIWRKYPGQWEAANMLRREHEGSLAKMEQVGDEVINPELELVKIFLQKGIDDSSPEMLSYISMLSSHTADELKQRAQTCGNDEGKKLLLDAEKIEQLHNELFLRTHNQSPSGGIEFFARMVEEAEISDKPGLTLRSLINERIARLTENTDYDRQQRNMYLTALGAVGEDGQLIGNIKALKVASEVVHDFETEIQTNFRFVMETVGNQVLFAPDTIETASQIKELKEVGHLIQKKLGELHEKAIAEEFSNQYGGKAQVGGDEETQQLIAAVETNINDIALVKGKAEVEVVAQAEIQVRSEAIIRESFANLQEKTRLNPEFICFEYVTQKLDECLTKAVPWEDLTPLEQRRIAFLIKAREFDSLRIIRQVCKEALEVYWEEAVDSQLGDSVATKANRLSEKVEPLAERIAILEELQMKVQNFGKK